MDTVKRHQEAEVAVRTRVDELVTALRRTEEHWITNIERDAEVMRGEQELQQKAGQDTDDELTRAHDILRRALDAIEAAVTSTSTSIAAKEAAPAAVASGTPSRRLSRVPSATDCLDKPHTVEDLLRYNRQWARTISQQDPRFFSELAKQQAPEFLWIGCSDSRVPANQIVGLAPGEVFVHRNIANVVVPSDLNCLSVIQFAVEHLRVRRIIVTGHYGCGGVKAALTDARLGLADNWTRHVRDVYRRFRPSIEAAGDLDAQHDLLCELNVVEQLHNVAETTVIRDQWAKGSDIKLHGLVYSLSDGILKELTVLDRGSDLRMAEKVAEGLISAAHAKAAAARPSK